MVTPKPGLGIVFAKAPVAGAVKTRLVPAIGELAAARLHEALTRDVWQRLGELPACDRELHLDRETAAWPEIAPRRLQVAGSLGERMLAAITDGLQRGYPWVLIAGADVPELPVANLTRLVETPADLALGPVKDGGYYAIRARRAHPQMFDAVRWSSEHALADTVAAAARCGLSVAIGEPWHDLDRPEDLSLLPPWLRAIADNGR